jgi:hypothetical protein
MLGSVRHGPLAGFGIRIRSQVPPTALISIPRHSRTFHALYDVVPLTTTPKPRSSHLRPAQQPQQLRTITATTTRLQSTPEEMAEPTGLIAKSGIELLTFG